MRAYSNKARVASRQPSARHGMRSTEVIRRSFRCGKAIESAASFVVEHHLDYEIAWQLCSQHGGNSPHMAVTEATLRCASKNESQRPQRAQVSDALPCHFRVTSRPLYNRFVTSSFFEKIFLWDADERRPDPRILSAFVGVRRRPQYVDLLANSRHAKDNHRLRG